MCLETNKALDQQFAIDVAMVSNDTDTVVSRVGVEARVGHEARAEFGPVTFRMVCHKDGEQLGLVYSIDEIVKGMSGSYVNSSTAAAKLSPGDTIRIEDPEHAVNYRVSVRTL